MKKLLPEMFPALRSLIEWPSVMKSRFASNRLGWLLKGQPNPSEFFHRREKKQFLDLSMNSEEQRGNVNKRPFSREKNYKIFTKAVVRIIVEKWNIIKPKFEETSQNDTFSVWSNGFSKVIKVNFRKIFHTSFFLS